MTGRFEHFDARPGGSYRLVLAYADASAAREVRRRLRRGRWEVTRRRPHIRADDVPDGINAADHAADCRPRWTISPLPLNAERRLPRSTVLVATATIRVVATERQIYGRHCSKQATTRARIGIPIPRRAPGQIALREPHHLALEITNC